MASMTLGEWKRQLERRLNNWSPRSVRGAGITIYAFCCASALAPVALAALSGDPDALPLLFLTVGNIGSNLVANIIQQWRDEHKAAEDIQRALDGDRKDELLASLEALSSKLDLLPLAGRLVSAGEAKFYEEGIRAELIRLGIWDKHSQRLLESGVIRDIREIHQGPGSQYIEGNVNVEGDFMGPHSEKEPSDE